MDRHKPVLLEVRKERLDVLLVKRGLVESKEKAKVLIFAGKVKGKDGETLRKPSFRIWSDSEIIIEKGIEYFSRGYLKLKKAFSDFGIDISGKICVDIGSSTGGFVQYLLERGAKKVYAVDVGKGLLHEKLRREDRVYLLEGFNARYLTPEVFERVGDGEVPEFATVDVSFISSTLIIKALSNIVKECLVLVKPNFELAKRFVKKGLVKDERLHRDAVRLVKEYAERLGFFTKGITESEPKGAKGNKEFFIWMGKNI